MNILVIGGSGYVAGLVLPIIKQYHKLHLYDLKPPTLPELAALAYTSGDACDRRGLEAVCHDKDVLLYMAMGMQHFNHDTAVITAFDASVKGVYVALQAANACDIRHAVYTSSMSVYDGRLEARYFPDEEITPDSRHYYGLTKRFGEEVCRNAARAYGMSVNALRLCHPMPAERWLAQTREGTPTIATTAEDVASALLAAIDYRGAGFEAFMISGDYDQRIMNMSKAKRLLDWQPLARPQEKRV